MPACSCTGSRRRIWDSLRRVLERDSIALALPGFGAPRPPRFSASKDAYAEWLAECGCGTRSWADLTGAGASGDGGGASVVWWPPELIQGLVGAGYRVVQFDNRDVGLSTHVDWASAPYGIEDCVFTAP